MKYKNVIAKLQLAHWVVVPALCAVHCVESDEDESPTATEAESGAGGAPAGETPSEGGAAVGGSPIGEGGAVEPARICGKQAEISVCDPLTAEPCPSGATCDFSEMMGGFKCFDDEEPAAAGEFCDNETKFCGAGLYCESSVLMVCQHYCCDDSDCEFGSCWGSDQFFQDGEATVGACYDEFGGLCALAEPGEEPEECLGGAAGASGSAGEPGSTDTAGAGGSAP
jgi:hypothetical protein